MKILVVDDDVSIVSTVRAYLEQAGYDVVTAGDGRQGLHAFFQHRPDLLVLDLMMPNLDGFEVVRAVRRESQAPIIMLTARVEETDKLIGLELGADDYITKPFSPREVVARVRAVLRRASNLSPGNEVLRVGGLVLDRAGHSAALGEKPLDLTPTEFSLLAALMENQGRVMTRLQLIEKALGYSYEGFERTIDAHIKNLRQKVELDSSRPTYIQTVYGVGYKLVGPAHAS